MKDGLSDFRPLGQACDFHVRAVYSIGSACAKQKAINWCVLSRNVRGDAHNKTYVPLPGIFKWNVLSLKRRFCYDERMR